MSTTRKGVSAGTLSVSVILAYGESVLAMKIGRASIGGTRTGLLWSRIMVPPDRLAPDAVYR